MPPLRAQLPFAKRNGVSVRAAFSVDAPGGAYASTPVAPRKRSPGQLLPREFYK